MTLTWQSPDSKSPSARRIRDDRINRRISQQSPYRHKADATLSSSVWDEFTRLYIDETRDFQKDLDQQVAEQEQRHRDALAAAAAEHERVRESAERAREKVELELARERKRREHEEQEELSAMRKAESEREAAERKRIRDDLEREKEEQARRTAEQQDIEATRQRLAEQRRKDEEDAAARRKQEQEDADKKAQEQTAAAAAAKATPSPSTSTEPSHSHPSSTTAPAAPPSVSTPTQAATQPPPSTAPTPSHSHPTSTPNAPAKPPAPAGVAASSSSSDSSLAAREAIHSRYLSLHQRLKDMRRYVISEGKKNPQLKQKIGDWRRKIIQTVGQLTTDKGGNRQPMRAVTETLQEALKYPQPSIDVASYLISSPLDPSAATPSIPMSGPFIYLLNILSKSIISQLINEASVNPRIADPIGVMAVSIFAQPAFHAVLPSTSPSSTATQYPLIDILLAKYHAVCPILFGISGPESTPAGRTRLGWWKESGAWVSPQRHSERMAGLAAGYAAISLRDFSKSKNSNPFPPRHYWSTLSGIVNTKANETQATHFYVLKGLIDGYVERFVGFYGVAAVAALRLAVVEFPQRAERTPARDAVLVMRETLARDLKLTL